MAEKYKQMGTAADGMKTTASATADIVEAWNEIRSDTSPTTWCWTMYDTTTNQYVVSAKGSSMQEFLNVPSPDVILFGGLRVEKPAVKFIHVLWMGPNVSPLKKGKAQLHKSAAFNAMTGSAGEVSCSTLQGIVDDIQRTLRLTEIIVE